MPLRDVKALILDMDGVLWRDIQPLVDLPATFSEISRLGLRSVLATNNATLSADQYLEKLLGFGVELQHWQIVNSAQAVAHFLAQDFPAGGPVYIIGESGLEQSLLERGFHHSDKKVLAVIVGLDRQLTYEKLFQATSFIRAGALFIGTNPDRTFPVPSGLAPGAGSIIAAIEAATDAKPIIVGKPAPEMYKVALERLGVSPQETLVVGDRLETDIAGAQQLGCQTALVLSGVTTPDKALSWRPAPDLITRDLAELLTFL